MSVVLTGLLILAVSQEHNHRETLATNEGFGSLNLRRKRKRGACFLLVGWFVCLFPCVTGGVE